MARPPARRSTRRPAIGGPWFTARPPPLAPRLLFLASARATPGRHRLPIGGSRVRPAWGNAPTPVGPRPPQKRPPPVHRRVPCRPLPLLGARRHSHSPAPWAAARNPCRRAATRPKSSFLDCCPAVSTSRPPPGGVRMEKPALTVRPGCLNKSRKTGEAPGPAWKTVAILGRRRLLVPWWGRPDGPCHVELKPGSAPVDLQNVMSTAKAVVAAP